MSLFKRKQKQGKAEPPGAVSNCVYYVLDMLNTVGGNGQTRVSSHWKRNGENMNLHMQHIDREGKMTHFVPPKDLSSDWRSLLVFNGEVRDTDEENDGPASEAAIVFGVTCLFLLTLTWSAKRRLSALLPHKKQP